MNKLAKFAIVGAAVVAGTVGLGGFAVAAQANGDADTATAEQADNTTPNAGFERDWYHGRGYYHRPAYYRGWSGARYYYGPRRYHWYYW